MKGNKPHISDIFRHMLSKLESFVVVVAVHRDTLSDDQDLLLADTPEFFWHLGDHNGFWGLDKYNEGWHLACLDLSLAPEK